MSSYTISIIDLRRILPFLETSQERTNELHRIEILDTPSKTTFLNDMDFVSIIFSREKSLSSTGFTDNRFYLNCKYTLIIFITR